MLRLRLSSTLLLALGCMPACYCSHEVNDGGRPDAGTVIDLTDAAQPADSAPPDAAVDSDANVEPPPMDSGVPEVDMGPSCQGEGMTDPSRACVPAPQGGTLSVDQPSMVRVDLPNPGTLCAAPGAGKCDVHIDWEAGVLELCTYRVFTPGGAHECPRSVEAQCHFPPLEMARSWRVRINAADAFTIDSKVAADPDPADRCVGLDASMEEVRVRAD